LKYSKKYYSYVLVIEDDQQPECVGKIMIFQYGKTIKDKIQAERNGEITGVPCNVFDLAAGKDFVMLVKEISTGDETYPDYKNSMFKPEVSSVPLYNEEKSTFKNVPVADGKVDARAQGIVKDFLFKREHELEELTAIYVGRGLDLILAKQVAEKLMATDALGAHVRDELGLSSTLRARPLQASIASAASFTVGALVPMATVFLVPADWVTKTSSVVAVLTLFILGVAAAHLGGAALMKGGMRVAFWGVVAIGLTALVGKFFGTIV
jgi:hypothetical protein